MANIHCGDQLVFTSLPENFYKNTGEKLINVENLHFFSQNPYVIQGSEIHPNTLTRVETRDLWNFSFGRVETDTCKTFAEEICKRWDLKKIYKNRPDFYIYQNNRPYPRNICIATTGKTVGAIPLKILRYIREKYRDYLVWQIGGLSDVDAGADIDRRGGTFFDSCKIISECEQLITIDSAPYWLGKMYPNCRLKIILVNKNEQECENFMPRGFPNPTNSWRGWLECGNEYFNVFEESLGITNSFLEI